MNPESDLTEPEKPSESESPSALALIRQIQSGQVNPKTLSVESRRLCVAQLTSEGVSNSEVAEILKISDRTAARDRKTIREANAVQQDPKLLGEMVGRVIQEAETVVTHLRRVSRDKSSSAADKINAERGVWDVTRHLTQILQSLGFLPTAAHEVKAKVSYEIGQGASVEALLTEIERVQAIHQECLPENPERASLLERTKQIVHKIVLTGPDQGQFQKPLEEKD